MALLGCIADDFTGATDLANVLTRAGMATVQVNGLPEEDAPPVAADAIVVALKSRSIPASEAVGLSQASLDWLRRQGCRKIFFKYCSTFDSTAEGNIGPVAEALMAALDTDFTIACPALPENGRSVYQGHLFVGGVLLAETGMRHHPVTPMTDSNLVRVLQAQSAGRVGLLPFEQVAGGPESVRAAITALRADGVAIAIADAVTDAQLQILAAATRDLPLLTGGSGLALGLPALFREAGDLAAANPPLTVPSEGPAAVLSGSCSEATNRQVAVMRERCPSFRLDPEALAAEESVAEAALAWAGDRLGSEPVLIYSTAPPDRVSESQSQLGRERASALVERAMAAIAVGLVERGVGRLVVAGGETSGAVVSALGVRRLAIGPEIAPGVPWTVSLGQPPVALALKSGNFGQDDFFLTALEMGS